MRLALRSALFALFSASTCLGAVACGDDDRRASNDGGGTDGSRPGEDAGSELDASADDASSPIDGGVTGCPRTPGPADRLRRIVIGHPYDASGARSDLYRVLELSESGEVTVTDTTFRMGTVAGGTIAFTPDGAVGVAPQEDGSVGIFRMETDGSVTVLETSYTGGFYAATVLADPAGTHVWILDAQWRDTGGGIYRLTLDCDGSVLGSRLVAPSKLPYAMALRDDGTAVVGAKDVLGSAAGDDAHVVRLTGEPGALSGADVFTDEDWIVAGSALTSDGRHLLLGDNAAYSSEPNRVGVVAVDGNALSAVQLLSPIEDPIAIVASPFDDAAVVVSGFGNAILKLSYDADAPEPFTLAGELSYAGTGPQLPEGAVMIERGSLEGLVLVSENVAVRRVRFEGGGEVTDLGPTALGEGLENVVGTIGVQP